MKKILIIDHFSQTPDEPGNNRFTYLAEMLCEAGYQVEIITTTFSHKAKKQRSVPPELFEKLPYQYTMLPEPGYPKNVCLTRFYSHFIFGRNLGRYLASVEKPDLVYVAVPSLDAGVAAADYCRRTHVPLIVDIQDLWPEAFKLVLHIPVISDLLFLPMTWQADRFYAQADRIIAVSETYKERGLRNQKNDRRGLCVYLGTDLRQFDESSQSFPIEKRSDELWVSYAGTLGLSYNLELIMDAFNRISDVLQIHVVFNVFGDGPYLNRFRAYAENCRVPVRFFGRVGYPQMAAYLCKSDIAVNPITKGAEQSIINKHADYAAAGLPVVSTQECEEYRSLIEAYGCGINCGVESTEQVAAAIMELIAHPEKRRQMGANARKMAEEKFDRSRTYQQILCEINQLVG